MITTSEIPPSQALSPFIRCYSFIEFDTNGQEFIRPTHAKNEMAMTFHFKAKPVRFISTEVVQTFERSYGGMIGLFTQNNGDIIFNGHYTFFEIYFKPNGFYKIFKIPPKEMNNQLIFANDIFDAGIKIFYEQLGMANGFHQMCALADAFIMQYIKKQKSGGYNDSITHITNIIIKNAGLITIEKLAYEAYMSIRTLERHFIDQVGISPKTFCSITRFNYALELKVKNPQMNWTSIALASGYFDQMHLIKDFKKFGGNTPTVIKNQSHLELVVFKNENNQLR